MGGSSSKSTIEQLNDVAISVATQNVQSCSGSATQSQIVNVKGVKGDVIMGQIDQKQGTSIDLKCVFSAENQSKMQSDIAQELSNRVQTMGGDLTSAFGGTSTDQNTNIENLFKSSIDNKMVSEQVSQIVQNQLVNYEDIDGQLVLKGINQEQSARLIAEAIMNSTQYSGVINKIASAVDVQVETKGGSIFAGLFDMIAQLALYGAIVVVALVVGIAMFFGGKYALNWIRSKRKGTGKGTGKGIAAPRIAPPPPPLRAPVPIPPPPL